MAGGKCGLPLKICTRVVEDIGKFVFDVKISMIGMVCVPVAVVPPRRGCYKSGIFCLQDWQDAIQDLPTVCNARVLPKQH